MLDWIDRLFSVANDELSSGGDAVMLRAILMSTAVLMVYLFCVHIPFVVANKSASLLVAGAWLVATAAAWTLAQRGHIRSAAWLHCSVMFLISVALTLFAAPVQAMLLIPAVMHWAVLVGLRSAVVAGIAAILVSLFVALGGRDAMEIPVLFPALPLAVASLLVMPLVLTIVPVVLYMWIQRRVMSRLDQELAARREAEAALQEANELLDAKVKLRTEELSRANDELTHFSQRAAHDIRGAIGQVTGFISLALAAPSVKADERTSLHLTRATEAGRNLAQLVDSLLGLATLGAKAIKWGRVDLNVVVCGIRDELAIANPDRHIMWHIGALGECAGDLVLLRTVFQNLLSNAVKFTRHRADASIVVRRVERADGLAEIVIADNGVGFDMSHAERVFTGFQRLHSSAKFEGHGIGLASARKIVLMHGGTIEVAATEHVGATFRVLLPTQLPG